MSISSEINTTFLLESNTSSSSRARQDGRLTDTTLISDSAKQELTKEQTQQELETCRYYAQMEMARDNKPALRLALFEKVKKRCGQWSWIPPDLLTNDELGIPEIQKKYTWMGKASKREFLKLLLRCTNQFGRRLSKAELRLGLRLFEAGEDAMVASNFDFAMEIFEDLVYRFPNNTLGYYKLGVCELVRNGQAEIQQALRFFRCAIQLEPNNVELHHAIKQMLNAATPSCIQEGEAKDEDDTLSDADLCAKRAILFFKPSD